METGYRAVDADNHYYETLDACTRHLDPAFRERGVQAVQQGTHTLLLAGGRRFRFIPNPTFDPIIVAGCMDLMFRGQVPDGVDPRSLAQVEPLRPEYQDRDARIAVMDEQGLDTVLMFPTLACGIEQALRDDIPATMATLAAFNRWLDDDWGFDHRGRIVAVPMLSLADADGALEEVEWLLERGARIVHVRAAPVPTTAGKGRSLGDPAHDPVWARLAEASVPVAFHLGDSGYEAFAGAWGARDYFEPFRSVDVLAKLVVSDRPIHDSIGSMVVGRCVRPASRPAGRQHRERFGLGAPPGEAAHEAGQPDALGVRGEPARDHPPPRLGHAVLRGGHAQARRPARRGARAVRLGLAPR